jgi:hypothetical protein
MEIDTKQQQNKETKLVKKSTMMQESVPGERGMPFEERRPDDEL